MIIAVIETTLLTSRSLSENSGSDDLPETESLDNGRFEPPSVLETITNEETADTLIITGPSGAGKTYISKFAAERLREEVLDCLQDAIKRLHAGTVPVEQLVERNRVSKPLEGYSQNTQNVAALKRARDQDLAIHPGQDIEYVVVDDEKSSRERVALAHEEIASYDASYYETELVRAVESVLAPLGWDRTEIRREIAETRVPELSAYTNPAKN